MGYNEYYFRWKIHWDIHFRLWPSEPQCDQDLVLIKIYAMDHDLVFINIYSKHQDLVLMKI